MRGTKRYGDKFQQFVVDYVVEWEKVVTGRVDKALKTAEALRRDLDHYQKKVETLRLNANSTMSKGKQVDPKSSEKLSRNEEKFVKSKQEYNKFVIDLCILMEEITERSWRDLHPMLIKLAQFDMTLADDEAKVLGSLNQVVNELKRLAGEHGLKPQARLKDLESLNPELLCTRPGGPGNLTIESGSSPTNNGSVFGASAYSSISEPMAMPPGSVAPQGMGGFPVQIASSSTPRQGDLSRNNSYSSLQSNPSSGASAPPLSTMEMLHISSSAAPPPTLEQVQAANTGSSVTVRSAPNSGNWSLPPLAPPSSGNYRRTGSYGDYGAGGNSDMASVASAGTYRRAGTYGEYGSGSDMASVMSAPVPAPAAPPPPPPMNSPMSMYSPPAANSSMYSAPLSEPPMYSAYSGMDQPPMYGGGGAPPNQQWATSSNNGGFGGSMGGYGSPSGQYPSNAYGASPSNRPPSNSNPFDE